MSILHYPVSEEFVHPSSDERCKRNLIEDLKQGVELIFQFKKDLNTLHPVARENIIRMLTF